MKPFASTITIFLTSIISMCVMLLVWQYRVPIAARLFVNEIAATAPNQKTENSYGTEKVLLADSSGHYVLDAMVDRTPLHFMIDTGASVTVLSHADAEKLGYDVHRLKPEVRVSTGGGEVQMASITLLGVEAGQIRVQHLEALIAPDNGMRQSVLGMNFLRKLRSYSVESGKMTLVP